MARRVPGAAVGKHGERPAERRAPAAAGQMPRVTRPDPLGTAAGDELAEDGLDPAADRAQVAAAGGVGVAAGPAARCQQASAVGGGCAGPRRRPAAAVADRVPGHFPGPASGRPPARTPWPGRQRGRGRRPATPAARGSGTRGRTAAPPRHARRRRRSARARRQAGTGKRSTSATGAACGTRPAVAGRCRPLTIRGLALAARTRCGGWRLARGTGTRGAAGRTRRRVVPEAGDSPATSGVGTSASVTLGAGPRRRIGPAAAAGKASAIGHLGALIGVPGPTGRLRGSAPSAAHARPPRGPGPRNLRTGLLGRGRSGLVAPCGRRGTRTPAGRQPRYLTAPITSPFRIWPCRRT